MRKIILCLILVLGFVFLVSCSQQSAKGSESSIFTLGDIKNIKILGNQVGVKSGCSNTAPNLAVSNKDSVLDVVSKVEDWYAVKLPNNSIGFVPQSQSKPIVNETSNANAIPSAPPSGTSTSTAPGAKANPGAQTNANSTSLSSEEQQMVNLVNQARSQNGVAPLKIDMKVENCARLKAQDMITNKYFSHNSPTYGSPFDMMKNYGIKFVKAGENIAGNSSVQAAHTALMNSPGHRRNILDPDFTHIGIGVKNGGPYKKMFSQMFISK